MSSSPIFVIGTPRSGTTLLMRVLNSFDSVNIWGEHEGALTPLAESYFACKKAARVHTIPDGIIPAKDPNGPRWHGNRSFWQEDWLGEQYRQFVTTMFAPQNEEYWGFKETRYGGAHDDRSIEFLHEIFPQAQFIFMVRHPLNMISSHVAIRAEQLQQLADPVLCSAKRWQQQTSHLLAWHEQAAIHSTLVRYEDVLQRTGPLFSLLDSLGLTWNPVQDAVLGKKQGSSFTDNEFHERYKELPAASREEVIHIIEYTATKLQYELPNTPQHSLT